MDFVNLSLFLAIIYKIYEPFLAQKYKGANQSFLMELWKLTNGDEKGNEQNY